MRFSLYYVKIMNIEQDIDFTLSRLRTTARWMDALFYLPGTRISIGLDNILGIIPLIGDGIAVIPSIWMIWKARQLGATPGTLAYMLLNTGLDFLIGTIPLVGDIFDMLYNANIRNYRALERDLNRRAAAARTIHNPDVIPPTQKGRPNGRPPALSI